MKTELGYDWAFNQTTQDVRQTLKISTSKLPQSGPHLKLASYDLPDPIISLTGFIRGVKKIFQGLAISRILLLPGKQQTINSRKSKEICDSQDKSAKGPENPVSNYYINVKTSCLVSMNGGQLCVFCWRGTCHEELQETNQNVSKECGKFKIDPM